MHDSFENTFYSVGVSCDRNARHRRTMEDVHTCKLNFCGREDTAFFAVFDGHGGKKAVEFCGNFVPERLEELLKGDASLSPPDAMTQAMEATNAALREKEIVYEGCTVAACLIREEKSAEGVDQLVLYAANAGDTRSLLCHDGVVTRLSYDHKGSDPAEAQRITEGGGFIMANRVNGMLAVTRSLGDLALKQLVVSTPYTASAPVAPGDRLMIACDGIWDVISDEEAFDLIKDIADPKAASEIVIRHCLENGTMDNVSCMVVDIKAR
eukprot:Colp12_sorted_trinity150504_noHs@29451